MSARDVLHLFKSVKRAGDGWTARCPTHDDQHNSLSITDGRDGRILLHCHANAGCTYAGIMQAAGITSNNGHGHTQRAKDDYRADSEAATIYDYCDEHGAVLYQALRFDHPKDFRPRVPDGRGGFTRGLPKSVRRVLYRLPELIASEKQATIFIVEGEKDVDRLRSLGLEATTNIGGAGKWRAEYNEPLRGRHVCILPDNDESGAHHAGQVARALHGTAASVKIVHLPDLPPKGDVSDYLNVGGTIEQLSVLAADAPEWLPDASQDTAKNTRPRFHFTTLDDLLSEPEEQIAYVWERTLPASGFSICAAKPKVGKSTLARNLAVAVSRGADFFGRATAQGKIIYLCLEEKRAEIAAHFRRMGASSKNILIHTGRTPDDALEALEAAIEEHVPALVIIDPLSRFVRVADFNSYGEVTRGLEPLIDLARATGCHFLAAHHNGKMERDAGDGVLGSTGFFGAVDTLLTMKRREKARTLETVQRYGEDLPETVVHLDAETGLVIPGGDMQTLMLTERKTAVLESIGDEPLTEGDLKERIGGNQGLTSKAIRALFEEGRLERAGAGKKGDPYRYQKPPPTATKQGADAGFSDSSEPEESEAESVKNPSKNSGFAGFAIYEKPRNLETVDAGEEPLTEDEIELAARLEYMEGVPRKEAERRAREWFAPVPF